MDAPQLSPADYTAAEVVALLDLQPLEQEGGHFRRVALGPADAATGRESYSVAMFLVTPEGFSALHRLAADEVWCFLAGDPVESLRLAPDGTGGWRRLGPSPAEGDLAVDVVPEGTWQGTRLSGAGRWALVSVTVVPAFRWEDFELGREDELAALYPAFAEGIRELVR